MLKSFPENIIESFDGIVKKFPDRLAVRDENITLTYREIDEISDQIGSFLLKNKKRKKPVIFFMKPEAYSVAALVGILKSGNYCVMPNIHWSKEKLKNVFKCSNSQTIFTNNEYYNFVKKIVGKSSESFEIINIDDFFSSREKWKKVKKIDFPKIYFNDPAIVLFTSGTTGDPKGILYSHQNFTVWYYHFSKPVHKYNERDRMCCFFSSFAFLVTIFAVIGSLFSGSLLFISSPRKGNQMNFIIENKITILTFSTSFLREFISYLSEKYKKKKINWVKSVSIGGEPVYKRDVDLFRNHFSQKSLLVVNYCLTEFPFVARRVLKNSIKLKEDNIFLEVVNGVNVNLVDENGNAIKEKQKNGEIIVQSKLFSCCNWPALKTDPNLTYDNNSGTIFKTGDLGKWVGKNRIELLGRNDFVVKINSLKVSLEELQKIIYKYKPIKGCFLKVIENKSREKEVVLYYSSKKPINAESINEYLKKIVPVYSLPHHFIYLKKIPLSKNGKIDYSNLPKPNIS